ncbi:NADPH-dependent ferric siderophore reductase [Rhodobacter viridis]|uniref:NADPH-dependent ferric siderophore reductase n=1 Tax=Rhodobacter viridis TaxID=1054202 RepID=A0A318U765_9RHOB|nr:siderophore-interacting protein [Rhodobacter viridis]PYF10543.1 NADPH-dependent ferric siderophore reductase [Rhodobacter viridis]
MDRPVVQLGALAKADWPEIAAFARALAEFCKVHVSLDHQVTVQLEPGEIALRWTPDRTGVRLVARSDPGLQVLRDTLAHMLDTAREGLSAGLAWQDAGALAGQFPPNFRIARLIRSDRISPRFQRLRFAAEDIGFLATGGLHLRLLQPADPADPVWPRLAANGRTLWPGAGALHMPVYTIRAIDAAAGWIEVEVFLHGNGPTCAFAETARPGARVGLSGPGGGWLPKGARLCLGGDETALPVIARILQTAAPDTRGQVMIELGDPAEIRPLAAPAGVAVTWLMRGRDAPLGAAFGEIASAALQADPATEVLFGAEKSEALALRSRLKDRVASLRRGVSVSGYWARG